MAVSSNYILGLNVQLLISCCSLFFIILAIKPWKKVLNLDALLFLLFIDALTFGIFYINFYKIIALIRCPLSIREIFKSKAKLHLIIFAAFFTFIPILFGFIQIHNANTAIFHINILNHNNYISLIMNFFSLFSLLLFSYEIHKSIINKQKITISSLNILSIIISAGIIIEYFYQLDLFYLITGGRALPFTDTYYRPRGFAFEPRGATQCLAILTGAQLLLNDKKSFFIIIPFLIYSALLPLSFSGFFVAGIIIIICFLYFFITINKKGLIKISYLILMSLLIFNVSNQAEKTKTHIHQRSFVFNPLNNSNNNSLVLKIANHLEVGDAAYLNFIANNHQFLIMGTGIMNIHAVRQWILKKDYGMDEKYISNPLLGSLFLYSMYGIFSLFFLAAVLFRLIKSKNWKTHEDVLFNILIIIGGVTYFYILPFVIIACFNFSKKFFSATQHTKDLLFKSYLSKRLSN